MDYGSATDYLYNLQRFGIKLGLDNITELLSRLSDPHKELKCIHVGGTNGKGSVCAFIASVLQAQGYKVGLYTSPHLVNFTERLRINFKKIGRDNVVRLITKIKPVIESMAAESKTKQPTFFEVATAMAFLHFAENNVDFAVLEVGLGGRLDATNVIKPLVSVITRIAHEHTEHLGKRLDRIAWEKSGIIKENIPVVTSELKFQKVIRDSAKKKNARLIAIGKDIKYKRGISTLEHQSFSVTGKGRYNLKTKMLGSYQTENAAVAVGAVETLMDGGIKITSAAVRKGIYSAEWPGRFEIVKTQPLVILDCAHDPDGARALAKSLKELKPKSVTFVIGTLKDKDAEGMAKFLGPLADRLIITTPNTPRACEAIEVKKAFEPYVDKIEILKEVGSAVEHALSSTAISDTICIAGSIYTVGEAIEGLRTMKTKKIDEVMKRLRAKYLRGAFPGKDVDATTIKRVERAPFRVLIATILSHRTRDENTHLAVERLFKRFNTPEKIANANVKEIESLVKPAGFYSVKAKRLKEVSKILLEKFDGNVPRDFDALMSLPSVGRKTANCVLVYGFGIPAVPVDVHVEVIAKRLGLVDKNANVFKVEKQLQSVVLTKYWLDINKLLVRHGREICTTRNPKCTRCFIRDLCDYFSEYVQK